MRYCAAWSGVGPRKKTNLQTARQVGAPQLPCADFAAVGFWVLIECGLLLSGRCSLHRPTRVCARPASHANLRTGLTGQCARRRRPRQPVSVAGRPTHLMHAHIVCVLGIVRLACSDAQRTAARPFARAAPRNPRQCAPRDHRHASRSSVMMQDAHLGGTKRPHPGDSPAHLHEHTLAFACVRAA